MSREPETPKLLGDLTLELLLSLQVVRDASRGLRNGSAHQILPLAGQLRALLLEKRRDAHALLLHFASVAGVDPRVYVMPEPEDSLPHALPQPEVLLTGFPFSTSRVLPRQVEIPISDLPKRELIRHRARGYSIEELIKYYANRAGGSHYSRSVPQSLAQLLAYEVPGIAVRGLLLQAFAQIGQAVFEVGLSVVRRLTDLDFFLTVVVLHPQTGAVLLDCKYPDTRIRITLFLGDGLKLAVRCVALDGTAVLARTAEPLTPGEHIVRISLRHDDDLQGSVMLLLDGQPVTATATVPLFVPEDFDAYDMSLNIGVDGQGNAQGAFGLEFMSLYAGIDDNKAEAVIEYQTAQVASPERKAVYYGPGSCAKAPPGTHDPAVIGDARLHDVVGLLSDADSGR